VFESFPVALSQKLENADVVVASNSISTTGCGLGSCLASFEASQASVCTGTYDNPTAPAEKVCIYMIFKLNIDQQSVSASPLNSPEETSTKGFSLLFSAKDPGDFYIAGVWAYKAP
jgi:hypothetical protein